MMDIRKLLKETDGVDQYQITSTKRESYELFFVHRKLETVRATDTLDMEVTVYVNHEGKLGSSTFAVYPSMTEEEAGEKITAAVNRAKLIFNEPWKLPEAGTFSAELPSNFKDCAPQDLAEKIAGAVFAADDMEGGSINALEVFLYQDTIRVENSQGLDKTQVRRHAMVEAIPTWNEDGTSVELYENVCFTDFDPKTLTVEIAAKLREVRDRQHAEKPETPLTCDVLLRDKELLSLATDLARDLNFASAYNHSALHKEGDDLQPGGDCDKLELTMRGRLPGSVRSAFFDADGVELSDRVLISGGKVVGRYGSNRFAQYLGEKPTGDLACVELERGTLREEKLTGPYLDCVSLSGLQLDLYNDYIGGEIRLAYYHDGEKTRPVTGITMSASLSKVLASLRLSEDVVTANGYHGPMKGLLKDVSIL